MTFTRQFIYMAHHFILLRLNPFGLRVDREGWWFQHSMSWSRACLSEEGAKNVSCPSLSLMRRWGSLNLTFTGKFLYMAHSFILLRLNPFGFSVDRVMVARAHLVWLQVCLSVEADKNVSWHWLFQLRRQSSLTMTFTGKFVYMAHHFILLRLNPFGLRADRKGWCLENSVS